MSSTTGIQNLLVNVLRPVYTYDAVASLYTVKLDMSNVNTFYGVSANVLWAQVGDSASNVYVGKEAGNDPTVTTKNSRNVTAIGYGAGSNTSNVSNSTYLGFYAGAGAETACNVIAIGANANGNGVSNIFIGNGTGTTGSNNILIGHGIALTNTSYALRVGAAGKTTIAADLSQTWVGVGGVTARNGTQTTLDVSGSAYIKGNVGINILPGTRTLDVNGNFRSSDASSNVLDFSNGVTKSSGGYTSIRDTLDVSAGPGSLEIGRVRRGIIYASAIDTQYGGETNRAAYVYFAWTLSNVTTLASTSNGLTDIVVNSSNIYVNYNNGTPTSYDYSITYFPLP
jgi:hypothetical protein